MGMPVIRPSGISRCQAITDIIESVALEQAALSHILNAEGEKIQKVVERSTSAREMLYFNKSVKSMITSITKLEMILQFKLDLFEKCLCWPCIPVPLPCIIVEDVDIEEETENPDISVTKNTMVDFEIDNDGFFGTSSFIIIPTPDVPYTLQSAPFGVTFTNNILSINWQVTESGTIVLTVGTGDCAINVIINYQTFGG